MSDEKILLNKLHNLYVRKNMPLNIVLAIAKEFGVDIIHVMLDDVERTS